MAGHPLGVFRIKVDPSPMKIAQILEKSTRRFYNWKPAWQQIAPFLVEMLEQNIESEGSAIGAVWPALLMTSIERKNRPSGSHGTGPLMGTGHMLEHVGDRVSVGGTRLRVGPRDTYAFVQTRRRPFIGWTSATAEIAINVLNAHAKSMIDDIAGEISGG